jgi:hypothetical protein
VTEPPSGAPPPVRAELRGGEALDLRALAEQICRQYRREFPDEHDRYGDAGMAWCVHDNQYLLSWAVTEANGYGGFEAQVAWLAGILEARDFPLDRLARDLEIGAGVVTDGNVAQILLSGARFVANLANN